MAGPSKKYQYKLKQVPCPNQESPSATYQDFHLIHTEEKELEVEKHFDPGEEDPVFRQSYQEVGPGEGK